MSGSSEMKRKLTPFMAVVFIVLAITGLMMFFHLEIYGMKHVHEWFGILFVACGLYHLWLNWKVFNAHIKSGAHLVPMLAAAIIAVVLLFGGGGDGSHHRDNYHDGDRPYHSRVHD